MIGVYVIVDPEACFEPTTRAPRDPREVTHAALRGGASRIQLRAKVLGDRERVSLARDLATQCAEAGVPFVVNDRVDVAVLAGATEVHLGQDDLTIADARRIAPTLVVSRSTHDLAQVRLARDEGADRIAFGPVFPTRSKALPAPVVGPDQLAEAIELAARPLIAIGGIDRARARSLAHLRLAEIAVISAVCAADDPRAATAELREALA